MSKVTGKRKRSDTADIHELMAKEDLVEFGVATLKAYCKENGLGSTGTADKLIGNILAHFRGDKENHSPQLDDIKFSSDEKKPKVAKPKVKKERKAVKFGDVIADSTKVIVFDKNEPTNKKPAKRQKIETPLKVKPQAEVFQGFSIFDDDVFGEDKVVLDTEKMSSSELADELQRRGLNPEGTKREKIERLDAAILRETGKSIDKASKSYQTQKIKAAPSWLEWR
eukprot:TRINITY_DN3857_c0_g1_i1.p1 TRINITY_DN3857_c0_g1~~TRINITY_DN3857_c0_g1_i1.p1  ORF type:complete len:232 (+),score=64.30 TRINITY_DN3857_c0_g1_i1:22-696(+)